VLGRGVAAERGGDEQAARRRGEESGGEHGDWRAGWSRGERVPCRGAGLGFWAGRSAAWEVGTLRIVSVGSSRLRPLLAYSAKYAIGASPSNRVMEMESPATWLDGGGSVLGSTKDQDLVVRSWTSQAGVLRHPATAARL
jgi:hypothetical protein